MALVESRMSYLEPWSKERENPYVRGAPDDGFKTCNFSNLEYPVKVADARPKKNEYSMDTHGFAYHDVDIAEETLELLRANDKERVAKEYYPMVERLVKEKTGASKVFIFDHTVRRRDPSLTSKENPTGKEQPASLVHCDQSPVGATRRVYRHLEDEAAELLRGRAQIINVWRPLRGPVQEWPLATMDYRSLKESCIHPTNIFMKQYELKGQTVSISYSEDQKWYYLDHQNTNEVTFIKIWDSKEDVEAKSECTYMQPADSQFKHLARWTG